MEAIKFGAHKRDSSFAVKPNQSHSTNQSNNHQSSRNSKAHALTILTMLVYKCY